MSTHPSSTTPPSPYQLYHRHRIQHPISPSSVHGSRPPQGKHICNRHQPYQRKSHAWIPFTLHCVTICTALLTAVVAGPCPVSIGRSKRSKKEEKGKRTRGMHRDSAPWYAEKKREKKGAKTEAFAGTWAGKKNHGGANRRISRWCGEVR